MAETTLTNTDMPRKNKGKTYRYPNLHTVLMVEQLLEQHRDVPMKIAEVQRKLPKKVMHQTLKITLQYLWKSGKILYGPKGVQWIHVTPEHLRAMLDDTVEV